MIQKMFKFFNTFRRVILLLHVVTAHVRSPWKGKTSYDCLLQQSEVNDLCITAECHEIAKFMFERMDLSKDPCDDFYLFTCGKFLNRTEKKLPGIFADARHKAEEAVDEILELPGTQTDSKLLKLMKEAKHDCLKEGKRKEDFELILQEFGGLPMSTTNWNEDAFSWTNFYRITRKYGYEANNLFSIIVDQKANDTTHKILYVTKPKIYNYQVDFFESFFTINNLKKALGQDFIVDVTKLFGFNPNKSNTEMQHMFTFSIEFKKVFKNASTEYHEKSILEMENTWPSVPWLEIINILIAPRIYKHDDRIVVTCSDCMNKLNMLLSSTEKRVVANYVIMQFLLENIYFLRNPVRHTLLKHYSKTLGRICHDMTIKYFEMILDNEYIKRFYNQNLTSIARSMFDNIRAELKSTIQVTRLFNSLDQRELTEEKLESLEAKIGVNEDRILNYEELEKYYQAVNFSVPKNYFWEIRSFHLTEIYNSLEKTGKRTKYMRATSSVPSYRLTENVISISAATLQGVLVPNTPQHVSYGRMGRIIAHEVTHAFGPRGIAFNKDGKMEPWVDIYTRINIKLAQECFSKQFEKYKIPGTDISVSGDTVSNEVVADDGGYYLSYHAYNKSQNADFQMILPGFEGYSQKQMFWISHATSRCEKYDLEEDASDLATDNHPVDHLRISVGLQNSKEFSQDFACAKDSKMNPTTKCSFWDG